MPARALPVLLMLRHLESDLIVAEALLYPELSRLAADTDRGVERLQSDVRHSLSTLLEIETPYLLHRRFPPAETQQRDIHLTLTPPKRGPAWRQLAWKKPLDVTFIALSWTAPDGTLLSALPQLGIEVPARSEADLHERIVDDIRGELMRRDRVTLGDIFKLTRPQQLSLRGIELTVDVKTPRQRHATRATHEPAWRQVATDLCQEALPRAWEIDAQVRALADLLTARTPRSVLLVGPAGVGKTALVYELVRRAEELGLARTPFWETSGPRLMAGAGGYGMWQQRCDRVRQEASSARAVLLLGNLVTLAEVGKIGADAQGMADFFRPAIERGDIIALAECTPQQHDLLERDNPTLLRAFHVLRVTEPEPHAVRSILLAAAVERELDIEPDAIELIYRLHARYATYSAMPGRPLRFLRHLRGSDDDVAAIFSRETGLPRWLTDDAIRLDLAACESWFGDHILGQSAAVDLVVGLLAQLKAGLSRPGRPLASFMFIGPTGVGKTEMSKALAEYMFGDRERLTRYDMSEYADAVSVRRLVGGGVDGAGLLTASVREQPFSVLLFDEVEKAHADFFDLLLQMLGEARLTDAAGRLADFRNTIVVMTSNAGAVEFRQGTVGFVSRRDADRAATHFNRAVRQMFRPELFNRLDRIVPFAPLTRADALAITRRELQSLWRRDGLAYRAVEVQCHDGVAAELAQLGFDARYGARPLKRAIERRLLVPLAEGLNRYASDLPLRARLGADLAVVVEATRRGQAPVEPFKTARQLARLAPLRRQIHRAVHSPPALKLHNDIFQLRQLAARLAKRKHKAPHEVEKAARLPQLEALQQKMLAVRDQLDALETQALLDSEPTSAEVDAAEQALEAVFLELYATRFEQAHQVTIAFFGTAHERVRSLCAIYLDHMQANGIRASLTSLHLWTGQKLADERATFFDRVLALPAEERQRVLDDLEERQPWQWEKRAAAGLDAVPKQFLGLVVEALGPNAFAWYGNEEGVHSFVHEQRTERCFIQCTALPTFTYFPHPSMARRPALDTMPKRRLYVWREGHVDDRLLGRNLSWPSRDVADGLRLALRAALVEAARQAIFGAS